MRWVLVGIPRKRNGEKGRREDLARLPLVYMLTGAAS